MTMTIRTSGDHEAALKRVRLAKLFAGNLKDMMSYQGLQQGKYTRTLNDGTQIRVRSVMGNQVVDIISAPQPRLGQQVTKKSIESDVLIAYNVPARNGAWDVDGQVRVGEYSHNVPTETWAAGEPYWPNPPGMPPEVTPSHFTTSSLQGDPLVYWFNHADPGPHPERDTRINVLKTWTYNVKALPVGDGWLPTETVSIFHRKSISFLDQIRGSVFPYQNSGDSIDVYHGARMLANIAPRVTSVYSNLWSTMNFYVAPNGNFTIVYFYCDVWSSSNYRASLWSKTYTPKGALVSQFTAVSSTITCDFPRGLGPVSVAYDGSDYYCTVNCGDIQGGHGGLPVFTEGNIYVSAAKLYDYDPVNRVIVSMDKVGYVIGDSPPTQWWLGAVSWYDFVRSRWYSMDMNFEGDAYNQEFILFDGVGQVFSQSDASAYTGSNPPLDQLDLNPRFWCRYDGGWNRNNPLYEFPLPFYPWNIHYTLGGYQRICTQAVYDNNRPLFNQWSGFSQVSGT